MTNVTASRDRPDDSGLQDVWDAVRPGTLTAIIGDPATGKTAIGLQIALHAAAESERPVLFLSSESTTDDLARRLLVMRGRVDIGEMINPVALTGPSWSRRHEVATELQELPLFFRAVAPRSRDALRQAITDAVAMEDGLQLIVVDDAGILELTEPDEIAGLDAIVEVARELRELTRAHDLAIVFCVSVTEPHGRLSDSGKRKAGTRVLEALFEPCDVIVDLMPDDDADSKHEGTTFIGVLLPREETGVFRDYRFDPQHLAFGVER